MFIFGLACAVLLVFSMLIMVAILAGQRNNSETGMEDMNEPNPQTDRCEMVYEEVGQIKLFGILHLEKRPEMVRYGYVCKGPCKGTCKSYSALPSPEEAKRLIASLCLPEN